MKQRFFLLLANDLFFSFLFIKNGRAVVSPSGQVFFISSANYLFFERTLLKIINPTCVSPTRFRENILRSRSVLFYSSRTGSLAEIIIPEGTWYVGLIPNNMLDRKNISSFYSKAKIKSNIKKILTPCWIEALFLYIIRQSHFNYLKSEGCFLDRILEMRII